MPTWLIVFLFALGAVALFVVGMSLTLMIKYRNELKIANGLFINPLIINK